MSAEPLLVVVLAAGQGTRMKSEQPKVLHKIAGRSMLAHVLGNAKELSSDKVVLIVGPDMDEVSASACKQIETCQPFIQSERLGTAHAVLCARDAISDHHGHVLVLYADTPLLTRPTLEAVRAKLTENADMVVLGFEAIDPQGYGRLLEGRDGALLAIREEKEASEEEKNITLCNSGVMGFRSQDLLAMLDQVDNNNAKGEYYLTDLIEIGQQRGKRAEIVRCSETEVLGVNDRPQLAEAENLYQQNCRKTWMQNGVTLVDPSSVYFSYDTQIEHDVIIEPNVFIGPGVSIGKGSHIKAFCHLENAIISEKTQIGPFARLRPGTEIGDGAKVGNFVEMKNATLDKGAKVNHLTYIGDAEIGEGANIGAGTITCNYDGYLKHKTIIGKGAFVGSNSSLIAPVKIGEGAYIGSGSAISGDVESDGLSVTRAKRLDIKGWAAKFRLKQAEKKSQSS